VRRINAVIDDFEAVDVMGRQRQEIARKLAADTDRYKDLLDASEQCTTVALAACGTSLTTISGVGPIRVAMIMASPASVEPARQPETELGAPRCRDLTARTQRLGPRVL
jgi:hypothetical protein